MDAFLTVALKVLAMLIMMAVGWLITKKGVMSERGTSEITWILLNIVTPCLIISSFASVKPGEISSFSLVLSALTAALAIGMGIVLSLFFFKKEKEERKKVLRFAMIYSNAGFMGMPLITGVLGDNGVIYGSFFIAVFNLICWTFGYHMMSGGAKIPKRKIFFNPGTIGLLIGLPMYIFGFRLPEIVMTPIDAFTGLNTPLAMLVVGTYIAKVKFKEFVSDIEIYKVSLLRLVILPVILIGVLCLIRPEYNLFVSTTIQACAPTAANCVLFAVMFGADARLASKTVAATTLLSVITMPLIIILSQFLAGLVL